MTKTIFASILATYLLLLCGMGYLAFFEFPGSVTLPSPEMVEELGKDEDFKKDLLEDLKQARDRDRKLIELAGQSFNIILGATLGFLSAVGAGKLKVSDRPPPEPNSNETEDSSVG